MRSDDKQCDRSSEFAYLSKLFILSYSRVHRQNAVLFIDVIRRLSHMIHPWPILTIPDRSFGPLHSISLLETTEKPGDRVGPGTVRYPQVPLYCCNIQCSQKIEGHQVILVHQSCNTNQFFSKYSALCFVKYL